MKPANLVLDLLRTYGKKGTDVRGLMDAAVMFQITENTMRVTLSRLTQRGLVEKVRRGHYRLADESDPINDFVEEWRLGEQRRRPWQENRFLIAQSSGFDDKDQWLLNATGFREWDKGCWMRPDNLKRTGEQLKSWLTNLGLSQHLLAENAVIDQRDSFLLRYELDAMNTSYRDLAEKLNKSSQRLTSLPTATAMKESFTLGGKALQLLAKDPYLPEEIQNPAERKNLWQIMLDYDELGRSVWNGTPKTLPADRTSYA